MANTSLDFIASLNVDVVDISSALHQHVGHGEHQTPQPVVLVHLPNNRVDQELTENTFSGVCRLHRLLLYWVGQFILFFEYPGNNWAHVYSVYVLCLWLPPSLFVGVEATISGIAVLPPSEEKRYGHFFSFGIFLIQTK